MRIIFLSAAAVLAALLPSVYASSLRVEHLRCEYLDNPLGIDVTSPRLSWIIEPASPSARGIKQTAYRILVASSPRSLESGVGDLWDSGRVASDQSIQVAYAGKPLNSGAHAFWKVELWDQAGESSGWSKPASWSMGLLNPDDWKARWIGLDETGGYRRPGSPYHNLEGAQWIWSPASDTTPQDHFFRASVAIPADRKLVKAICVIGADHDFELFVNGVSVGRGDNVRTPEIIEISAQLKAGANTIGVRARGRRNNPPGLIAAIRADFIDGKPLLFTTNAAQWKTAPSAAIAGWEQAGFDDSGWSASKELGAYGAKPWGPVGFVEERALAARLLRKEFELKAKPRRAMAYVSGLGLFELYVNGSKIGDEVLSPGLTDYDKRVQYIAFDVTQQLKAGRNAIGLMLGNGRYHGPRDGTARSFGDPKAILQLEVESPEGSVSRVLTDDTWKLTASGAIRGNNEYDGEEYDARMELQGWAKAGYNDVGWQNALNVAAPAGRLVARLAEPLRVVETVKPVNVHRLRPGVYIFDLGQNMVGWSRLHVAGPRGTQVMLRYAETLQENGELYVANLRSAQATDLYTLKGGSEETWEPRFTYHGFRYVEVTGYPGEPSAGAIEGRVVQDAVARVADFTSSNELLNHLHKNIFWGVRSNYRSIPTDCPQRDERQGWMGDRSAVSRSESYLFDVAAFYNKWMNDIEDAQRPDGSIPDVAPTYWVLYNNDVTWPSTFVLLPGMLYDQYGDRRAIETHYPAMRKWIEHMRTYTKDGLMPKDQYADWCVPPESPKLIHSQDPARRTNGTLLATAYFYKMLRLMNRYATLLGKTDDAAEYDALAVSMKTAFLDHYFKASLNQFDNGTQTSAILPLAFDMEPQGSRQGVLDHLVSKIHNESNDHVGVGLIGAQWLMRTLSDNGQADLAYKIATQTTYPGWGYMIEKGATTIWELWNGDTADPAMNSGNHVMQIGDLGLWLYEYVAGIRSDPEQPGFKHIVIRPYPVDGLTFAKASHECPYGTIRSGWKREGARFTLEVSVPPNTTASVYVPRFGSTVTESGHPANQAKGATFVRDEAGAAVYNVESGSYSFTAQ
ncbi:MAG TPA: family 78 glycoside hydrolase catalytic domain [Bryobacteraceae bacterium]|nr:family 78 glycoside hydrolase catalytic domain [Bryobacteraceae bacterium]